MTKYKKFKDCKEGDYVYCVEISNISANFSKTKIRDITKTFSNKDNSLYLYFEFSPMSFDVFKNSSNWHKMIFTTEEEAIKETQNEIPKRIKNLSNLIEGFSDILENIDNIEFKEK